MAMSVSRGRGGGRNDPTGTMGAAGLRGSNQTRSVDADLLALGWPWWKGNKGEQEDMDELGENAGPGRADMEEQDSKSQKKKHPTGWKIMGDSHARGRPWLWMVEGKVPLWDAEESRARRGSGNRAEGDCRKHRQRAKKVEEEWGPAEEGGSND